MTRAETTAWTAAHVARIAAAPLPAAPLILETDLPPSLPGLWLWDSWPLQDRDGRVVRIAGIELWFALSAPCTPDPLERHGLARIRLLAHDEDGGWRDLGDAMPDGLSPGSREWSGSATLIGDVVHLWFTAAGRRHEPSPTFEQRLFSVTAQIVVDAGAPRLIAWTKPVPLVASDGVIYHPAAQATGAVGTIKAFRDPAAFHDPATGADHLLFTASLAGSASAFNGAIGLATRHDGRWQLQPPLLHADGVNNELERPHLLVVEGRYYLFWSTQGSVFAAGLAAPTGLYGMVADRLAGPWRALNGSGLVLANPVAAPGQAYSWLVLPDRRVASFIDHLPGADGDRFIGAPAPMLRLEIAGDAAWVEGAADAAGVEGAG